MKIIDLGSFQFKVRKTLGVLICLVGVLFFLPGAANSDLSTGLVAYYPFNGNADDASGNGNHGTADGAALTVDRFGNPDSAYSFDGIDDYIVVPDSSYFNFNYPITLTAWVYLDDNSKGGIVGQWGYGGLAGDAYILYVQGTKLSTYVPQTGNPHYFLSGASTLNAKQWYFVSMVSNGSLVQLFVNGSVDAEVDLNVDAVDSEQPLKIGVEEIFSGTQNYFNGKIDDVRIYNRALSEAEIQALYSLCPENYISQESYSGDCLYRPPGSVCAEYSDSYVWLVWDSIWDWASFGDIEIALGDCADYYHILNTNCIRLDGDDSDADLIPDECDNCPDDYNPDQADFDGDGVGNACDPDDDNDGLTDAEEITYSTDPLNPDTDGDGLSDGEEVLGTYGYITDPNNPDSDGDGYNDGVEVAAGTNPLDAGSVPAYMTDGFDQEFIDEGKWASLEFVRRINNGVLESALRAYGSWVGNHMSFVDPDTVNSIQADVTATNVVNEGAWLRARLAGTFYKDASGNDIHAQMGIKQTQSGGVVGYYALIRCLDQACGPDSSTALVWEEPAGWAVTLGESKTLSVSWNGETQFTFNFDGNTVTRDAVDYDANATNQGPPQFPFKGFGTRISHPDTETSGGYITATFDNVLKNGESYDSFSTQRISRSLWNTWEFVRRVENGSFESALTRYYSHGANNLTFAGAQLISGFQADVTVMDVANTNALPYARLAGPFYNDGSLGGGRAGDISAQVGIFHDGTQLIGRCDVVRCLGGQCDAPGEFEFYTVHDFVTVDLNTTHRLSINWDPGINTFTFGFDDETKTVDSPYTIAGPPTVNKGLGTRVVGIYDPGDDSPDEGGYIRALFDNVIVLNRLADTDGDGIYDPFDNCPAHYNPTQADNDSDGVGDVCDPDTADTDFDGIDDSWEYYWFGDLSQGPSTDYDNDGLNDLGEYLNGTDPTAWDTDGDYVSDGTEIGNGTVPYDPNSFTPVGTGAVRGVITFEGPPLTGVQIRVHAITGDPCGPWNIVGSGDMNPADGKYAIVGLTPGNYYLLTDNRGGSNYTNEFWPSLYDCHDAQMVSISNSQWAESKDFQLELGGSISGKVTEEGTTDPVGNELRVTISSTTMIPGGFFTTGSDFTGWFVYAYTQIDGSYACRGLLAGEYNVEAHATGYAPEFYPEGRYYDFRPVNVSDQQDVAGIDFTLAPDGDNDGMPDSWEIAYFSNTTRDGTGDYDNDGLNDLREYQRYVDPTNIDTDGDKLSDGYEVNSGSDPMNSSSGQIPMRGEVTNLRTPGVTGFITHFRIIIGDGFLGSLPGDISNITVTGPGGAPLVSGVGNFECRPQMREFVPVAPTPGPPALGEYTFTVTSGSVAGEDTDVQATNRELPIPDLSSLSATLTSSTPGFTWDPVTYADGPLYYSLQIRPISEGNWYRSPIEKGATSWTVPAWYFTAGETYELQLNVFDDGDIKLCQNRASTDWQPFTMASSLAHPRAPVINPGRVGVMTYTTESGTGLLFSVRIIDQDGVASNGSSHNVQVRFPGGSPSYSLHPSILNSRRIGDRTTTAINYEIFVAVGGPISEGPYTFTVTDPDGNLATLDQNVIVAPIAAPDLTTLSPSAAGEEITAYIDNVLVDGVLYDDFDGYTDISELDPDKWINFCSGTSIEAGQLKIQQANLIGGERCGLSFTNPESISNMSAEVRVPSVTTYARAGIGGWFFNNGNGDVFAHIGVTQNTVRCLVSEASRGDSLTTKVIDIYHFPNITVSPTKRILVEIAWDGDTFHFTATDLDGGTPKGHDYTPPGDRYPAVWNTWKGIDTRILLLVDDTTPTFSLAPVSGASRLQLRIFDWRDDYVIWQGNFDNESMSITVPPGVLLPDTMYKCQVRAHDAHDPMDIDNYSRAPLTSFEILTDQEKDNSPFIDLSDSGVMTWTSEFSGTRPVFWVRVHDAQGVPDDIQSVTVTFPGGLTEDLVLATMHPLATFTPTSGVYFWESTLPVAPGTYTFTVRDRDAPSNVHSVTEQLTVASVNYPATSSLSPANNALINTAGVTFDWDDVPSVQGGKGYYRLEIFDYDGKPVYTFATTQSQYFAADGYFQQGKVYRYRVTVRNEFWDQNLDNGASAPDDFRSMRTFIIGDDTPDSDSDGIPDAWESAYGLDPNTSNAGVDSDSDGLFDPDEYLHGTDPTKVDTDGDGFTDSGEVEAGSDPTITDFDNNNNGTPDSAEDTDGDGVKNDVDNCPNVANSDQADFNGDGIGDACQDSDGDGTKDESDVCPSDEWNDNDNDGWCAGKGYKSPKVGEWDNCRWVANPDQKDDDYDGKGNACDTDVSGERPTCGVGNLPPCSTTGSSVDDPDGDGLTTDDENNVYGTNPNLADTDGDGVDDGEDNCKLTPNGNQTNTDGDGLGDACDPDDDNDNVADVNDNCPLIANDQSDMDGDAKGDACDDDIDGDGLTNAQEIALGTSPTNPDTDGDGINDGTEVTQGTDPLTSEGVPVYKIVFEARNASGSNITNTWIPSLTWDEPSQTWQHDEVKVVAKLKCPAGATGCTNGYTNFASNVTFTLIPSNWEGVAINDTEMYTTQPSNDFSFDGTDKDVLTKVVTVGTGGAAEITFTLYAFDFGGQAKIMASTLDPSGGTAEGAMTLPLDSDKDLLPDKFEIDHAADGFDPLNAFSFSTSKNDGQADIDTSLDNTHHGDGITNFMEYRGVVKDTPNSIDDVVYAHERLSPTNKDLFVRGDNFANSIPASTAPGVLPFSVNYASVYGILNGKSAFEEAGIHVHDVTGMPSFEGPGEPPNIDILVVTNKTERGPGDNYIHTLLGMENGFINHPSQTKIRHWEWDLKGASYIGDAMLYAVLRDLSGNALKQATETYSLCLMHYIWNRPYLDEASGCVSTKNGKLDPLNQVEDYYIENGTGPDSKAKNNEDRCTTNGVLDGDRMDPNWTSVYTAGDSEWIRGRDLSVFDANNNGHVENPRVDDPNLITKEYTAEQLQLHTAIHEMGHAAGCDEQHTTDPSCVMYKDSPDWDRANHFSPYARGQIYIHNKTEY